MSSRCAALAGCLLIGCLPEAGPGLGEKQVSGRGISTLALGPAEPEGGRAMLFSVAGQRPADSMTGDRRRWPRDLYVLPPGSQRAELRLSNFDPGFHMSFDVRRRLYTGTVWDPSAPELRNLYILDLVSGERVDLGPGNRPWMSPQGDLFIYSAYGQDAVARTANDVVQLVPSELRGMAYLNGAVYANGGRRLWRLRTDGSPPEVVREDVLQHYLVEVPGRPTAFALVGVGKCGQASVRVYVPGTDPAADHEYGMVDTTRSMQVDPAGGRAVLLAPRTRAAQAGLIVLKFLHQSVEFHELPVLPSAAPPGRGGSDGADPEAVDPSCPPRLVNPLQVQFRPGSEEIWVGSPGNLSVLHADARVETVTGLFQEFGHIRQLEGTTLNFNRNDQPAFEPAFSSDGTLFAYRLPSGEDSSADELRLADTRASLNGSSLSIGPGRRGIGELARSGLMVAWNAAGSGKIDMHFYDRRLATRKKVLHDVRQLAVGVGRVVALTRGATDDPFAPGSLDLVDLESGVEQHVASNVTELLPFADCQSCPRMTGALVCAPCNSTGPGQSIAYVVQARVPWKHDGLWTATLP